MAKTENRLGVGMISDRSCVQNAYLIEQLQKELPYSCELTSIDKADSFHCLLMDCQHYSPENMTNLLHQVNEYKQTPILALINATHYGPYESLINWPGVNGIFYSNTPHQQLVRGLKAIMEGELWLPRRLIDKFLERNRRLPKNGLNDAQLTRRETQILQCVLQGATNADISQQLFVSEHTVKSHLYNIYKKIGVKNRLEASNWARNHL